MIFLQITLSLVIPLLMWHLGRNYRNGKVPYLKERGIRYYSKRASASEEAWNYANHLFFSMLFTAGINTGLISVIMFIPVVFKAPAQLWILCGALVTVQAVAGFLLPALCTEAFLHKVFDRDGQRIHSEDEEEDLM